MRNLTYALSGLLLFTMAQQGFSQTNKAHYEKTSTGIKVSFKNSETSIDQDVYLDVVTDKIVRVTAVPTGAALPSQTSLVIVDSLRRQVKSLAVSSTDSTVNLKTANMQAVVSLESGKVAFYDLKGQSILKEAKRNSSSFLANSYQGDAFYHLNQDFIVNAEEGIYGLGQHQNAVMNYNRGKQVSLLQYNTEIGIPFLLSTNNYGILWHNYSITKAGDVRPLLPLNAFKLLSKEGEPGWLTATYVNRSKADEIYLSRPESIIDYGYLTDQHKFPKGVNLAESKVIYEGSFSSPYTGRHVLHFKYSGYMKVWIDGEQVADRWRQSWNAGTFEIESDLQKDKTHQIRMEWIPDGGESYFTFNWQSPIPEARKNIFSFNSEAGDAIDYYFVQGASMDEVIAGYRHLSGKAPIMPLWSFGFWQSRERYKTQAEIEEVATEFRKRKIPIDNIVQDWSYWSENDWGSQKFDGKRFPDPQAMVKKLHDQHFKIMISAWPKINEESSVYQEFKANKWIYPRNIYDGRKDWIGKGYTSTFYDPFNKEARDGFWKLLDNNLFKIGIDAWWMDASEPDIHSNIDLDERKSVFQPSIGSSVRYYNAFPLQNAKGIYEGQRETDPNKRVFILTRSFFAGQQRYAAAAWSGDIASRWHDMKDQIAGGINFSMSGTPYWTMDAGGFLVENRFHKPNAVDLEEWRELNSRWYQYGAFLPLFRAHGQYPYREPYNIAPADHPAYKSMTYAIGLRYKLLAYNYSLAAKTFFGDYTMIRGLAMDFPQDKDGFDSNDQYLWGPSLLINPVTEKGATSRKIHFPKGTSWYDLYNGKMIAGGQDLLVAAPYERIPVYVRAGSILPIGPVMQYTTEKKADVLDLYIYAGANGQFSLYEDEGCNYNYEKGKYSRIDFSYDNSTHTLSLANRRGDFEGMLTKRKFNIIFVSDSNVVGLDVSSKKSTAVTYTGKAVQIKLK
ncbi:MAG: DUF5110 domain-containing protein [Sphingobacterium sp.]|jgi:alpha-D-xyloside xylohydrolase|uniref:TIM-barrel domain-containing protein n=1 Tax=Sphingobacterium sp. TaxID=341027 RepID=UPI0028518A50|nr:TIM-barrel domain-containing protein [Sphingobacterium sp.]MDR3006906.1 DUF5110 domain-containing protein [Sphingobacterium sp.]